MTEMPATSPPPRRLAAARLAGVGLIHALLIGASILMLYPLLWMLSASVRPEAEIFSSPSIWPLDR